MFKYSNIPSPRKEELKIYPEEREFIEFLVEQPLIFAYEEHVKQLEITNSAYNNEIQTLKAQNFELIQDNKKLSYTLKEKADEIIRLTESILINQPNSEQNKDNQECLKIIESLKKDQNILLEKTDQLKERNLVLEEEVKRVQNSNLQLKIISEKNSNKAFELQVYLYRNYMIMHYMRYI